MRTEITDIAVQVREIDRVNSNKCGVDGSTFGRRGNGTDDHHRGVCTEHHRAGITIIKIHGGRPCIGIVLVPCGADYGIKMKRIILTYTPVPPDGDRRDWLDINFQGIMHGRTLGVACRDHIIRRSIRLYCRVDDI